MKQQIGCTLIDRLAPLLVAAIALSGLGCAEDPVSPSTPEASPELAAIATAAPLAFAQVSTGTFHSCGVTTDGRAYCWGGNDKGQLGDGTTFINTARTTPSAVIGGLRFRHVSVGYEHSCGITLDDRAFCWGMNFFGQLGNGTQGSDHFSVATPAEVVGGRRFRQVRAGYSHTCAITRANIAYCWGENVYGQLGDGTVIGDATPDRGRATPVRVLGGVQWRQLSGGGEHTCGVTQTDQLYCWGLNEDGQLGNGTTINRTRPVPVSGGRQFRQVEAGGHHTCAVTTGNLAYCWGLNFNGALGDGTTTRRLTPGAVAGLRRFDHVNAGDLHTCGVTLTGRGFCWGRNEMGQLGNGTLTNRTTPVLIAGGLTLSQVSAGLFHSCGVTTGNRAYCWGSGGLLGDGTFTRRLTPVPVVGPI
jgi:alpha-tubulin suppressor-like RCC1 family protein